MRCQVSGGAANAAHCDPKRTQASRAGFPTRVTHASRAGVAGGLPAPYPRLVLRWRWILFALFVVVPIVEIALLVAFAGAVGVWRRSALS